MAVWLANITVIIMYRNIHFIAGGKEESWKNLGGNLVSSISG